jgi:hypothetical protein
MISCRLRKPTLRDVLAKLEEIEKRQKQIMADTTKLTAAVAANTTAVTAVQALVTTLRSGTDQAAVDAATTQVENNNATLNALNPTAASS